MDITKYPHQILFDRFATMKKSLVRFCSSLVFASGLLTTLPVMSAPVLEIGQAEFFGVFGVDYPVFNIVADISDGDPETTDYFFEGIFTLYDDSGNQIDQAITSTFDSFILMQPNDYFVFPAAGDYILYLDMTTWHQVGGLPGCHPYYCNDVNAPFTENGAFDSMAVHLSSVPVPAAAWLFGSGLIGLIAVARRKVRD